ncbi:NAD(P)/FAD-dependent oxidoreductase [Pseudomarimonas salicorniae]|uniref:NAD(P)/FAD-dependent oxidoreductase n=1 Tax=Pseudomarimonas salicorniae TaxID=2933270 RepID=A0ABT0GFP8_9GAMM|nr:NAD(P)/FAD-dependent oxidoreductase [Lysobacter sp. CAU 1642]MCK7593365.1 NAD(P)/FAD-dependent oxidoreductase [Lysobacter sp. CAU 1642]
MTTVDIEVIVVGAGVVGLACGVELAKRGREVLVVEREARAGEGVSSRNSGVIHAGLYYPPGSLKARVCVRGRELLYAFCAARGVPHRRCGKWVVAATEDQLDTLRHYQARAAENGVGEVHWVDGELLRRREPALGGVAALDVPQSGFVDVAEYVMALSAELQRHGGQLLTRCEVERIDCEEAAFAVSAGGESPIRCRQLVNAGGLGAQALARRTHGFPQHLVPPLHFAAGHYYRMRGNKVPFDRLVYPLPGRSGLGVHLGFDAAGLPRFGPDVRFIEREAYDFDDSRRAEFAAAIREWWPGLRDEDLLPDFVGVRPKLVGPESPTPDFVLQGEAEHGLAGLVQLFGIESPGLTSSLAIAEEVADRLA